jgi:hypothetical protein
MKHYLVIAMNDDRKASPHFVSGESNLRAKLEELIFFEREFSKERDAEMDCYMIEIEDKGSITFEGDPPIYVYETYADASVFDEKAARESAFTPERDWLVTSDEIDAFVEGARWQFDQLTRKGGR